MATKSFPAMLRVVQGEHQDRGAMLVRSLVEGQAGAAAAFFDEFAPLVRTMLRRQLGPSVELDDLTQEVFLRVFRRVDSLRDPSSIRSFVMGVVIRVVRTELTRRWMQRWLSLTRAGDLPETSVAPADHEARLALSRLYRILDGASADGRTLFVLRHIDGLEIDEIARVLGVSPSTVKRRLARVGQRLFARIEQDPVLAQLVKERGMRN